MKWGSAGPHEITLGEKRIVVAHDEGEIPNWMFRACDVLVTAHTHTAGVKRDEGGGGPLLVNPGETGGWLTGRATGVPHAALYWRSGPQRAVRRGDTKLVRYREPFSSEATPGFALYDLAADPGESRDLTDLRPDAAAALRRMLEAWEAGLPPPLAFPAPARETPPRKETPR